MAAFAASRADYKMAYAIETTVIVVATDTAAVPFPYLDRNHVILKVDGALVNAADYEWTSSTTIALLVGEFQIGETVVVQRITPAEEAYIQFTEGQLEAKDLNDAHTQLLYIMQEVYDGQAAAIEAGENITDLIDQAEGAAAAAAADAGIASAAAAAAGPVLTALVDYLTIVSAAATYLTIAGAAAVYQTAAQVSTAITNALIPYALKAQTLEGIAGLIPSPSAQTYMILLKAPHAGTITETTTICTAGTCTMTFKINGVSLGGTANAVSTSEQSQAHASANAFAAGDDISVQVTVPSAIQNGSFTIKYSRSLA